MKKKKIKMTMEKEIMKMLIIIIRKKMIKKMKMEKKKIIKIKMMN